MAEAESGLRLRRVVDVGISADVEELLPLTWAVVAAEVSSRVDV